MNIREIFAEEILAVDSRETGFAEMVRSGMDNSNGGTAAIRAMERIIAELGTAKSINFVLHADHRLTRERVGDIETMEIFHKDDARTVASPDAAMAVKVCGPCARRDVTRCFDSDCALRAVTPRDVGIDVHNMNPDGSDFHLLGLIEQGKATRPPAALMPLTSEDIAGMREIGEAFGRGGGDAPSKTREQALDEVTAISVDPGNAFANEYMLGMANGLILAQSIFKNEEPKYLRMPEADASPPIEDDARRLYNASTDDSDIHSNRLPTWDELTLDVRNQWRDVAIAAKAARDTDAARMALPAMPKPPVHHGVGEAAFDRAGYEDQMGTRTADIAYEGLTPEQIAFREGRLPAPAARHDDPDSRLGHGDNACEQDEGA